MAEVGRIQIEVDARDVDKAVKGLNDMGIASQRAGGKVGKYEKDTKKATRATDKMSRSSKRLTRMFSFLGVGLGGLTFGALAQQIGSATTQLNNIQATMRVAAGSSKAAGEQLAFIREESERLGLFLPAVAKQMAQFSAAARGTSITSEELKTIFTGISEASRAMGLTAPQTEGAMMALQQMMSKGKVSAEELRQQLGERMPGSIQIMAQSLGVGTQELFKMMENGELLSDEVLPKFGRELSKVFGQEAQNQANKLAAAVDRLRTSFFDLMAQDKGLPGASSAINELAEAVASPGFQKGFDGIIQIISNFMGIVAQNLDHVVELIKLLGAAGLGLAGAQAVKILSSVTAVMTSLVGKIVATNTATVSLIGSMTTLSTVLSRIAWPVALITGTFVAIESFREETETAAQQTKKWADELKRVEDSLNGISDSAPKFTFDEALAASEGVEQLRDRVNELRETVEAQREQGLFSTSESRDFARALADLRAKEAALNVVRARSAEMIEELYDPRRGRARAAAAEEEARRIEERMEAIKSLGQFDDEIASSLELGKAAEIVGNAFETLYPADLETRNKAITDFMEKYVMQSEEAVQNTKSLSEKIQDFQNEFGVIAEIDPQVSAAFELQDQLSRIKELNLSKERTIALEKQAMEAYRESNKEVDDLERQFLTLEAPMSKVERDAKEIADAIRGDLSTSITDVIMDVESLSDAFASLARQIARTMIQKQIADPLANQLTSFATSSIGSLFGGSTAGTTTANIEGFSGSGLQGGVSGATMLGGDRANGGNVFSNKAHLVGERGPELFVPGQDGRIIPNTEMGGGGNVTVNVINQGGEQLEAQQQQTRRGPNGEMTVDVMVKKSMERLDSQGQLDGIFRRHGARRQGQF